MNRKRLSILALLLIAVFAFTAFVACNNGKHEHNYDKRGHNELYHWMECSEDGEKDSSTMERHKYGKDGKCTVCDYEQGSGHDHVYGTEYKTNRTSHWKECTVQGCGNRSEVGDHEYPTEGENINACTVCGYVRAAVHVHTMAHVDLQPATCTEAGLAEHWICTASICSGRYFSDENATEISKNSLVLEIDPDNHKIEEVAAKVSTCTINGNNLYYECELCHSHFEDDKGETKIEDEDFNANYVLPVLGHEYDYEDSDEVWELVEGRAPGCVTPGLEKRTCQRAGCTEAEKGHVDTREIPATGHINGFVHVDEQDATCEEPGWVEHYACELCKMTFEDAEGQNEAKNVTIPAKGHDLRRSPAEEATCEAPGKNEYWYCNRTGCDKKWTDQTENEEMDDTDIIIPIDENNHAHSTVYIYNDTHHWYEVTCIHAGGDIHISEGVHIISNEAACLTCGYMRVKATTDLLAYSESNGQITITGLAEGHENDEDLHLVLPSTIDDKPVVAIGDGAFSDNLNIVSVVIDGIPKIGNEAFSGCRNLSALTLVEGVRWAYSHSFYGCSSLKGVVFPVSMDGVGFEAFMGSGLTWVVLDDYYDWDGFPDGEKKYFNNNPGYYPEAKIQEQAFPYSLVDVYSRGTIKWEGQQAYSASSAIMRASWKLAGNWVFTVYGEPFGL